MASSRGRALLVVIAAGCAGPAEVPAGEIRADAVLAHARVLALDIGARPHDSETSARAAAYIEGALGGEVAVERLPVGRVDIPAIDLGPLRWREAGTIEVADDNLLVRVAGRAPGPAILFMAHYDSVPGSPGAADNAASVGVLIELARALARRPPARAVLIAFTAAEESGLVGARALAARLAAEGTPVGLAISLDLVGAARTALNGLGPLIGRGWLRWIAARAGESGADLEVPVPHRVTSRVAPAGERSDHGAFTEREVPAFHLYGRGPDRVYLAYHTAWDVPERLDAGAIDSAGRLAIAFARAPGPLPTAGGDPGFWLPGTSIVLPGWLVMAGEGAMAALALFLLVRLVRGGGARARGPGAGLAAVTLAVALSWVVTTIVLMMAGGDHPMPWVHAPGAALALALAIAAATGALAVLSPLGRRFPLVGRRRYAVAGVLPLVAAGAGLLALGAHELAWMPLAAGALLAAAAIAPGRAAPLILLGLAIVPLSFALSPAFLREAAFNGFYPPVVPLPVVIGFFLAPHAIAGAPLLAQVLPRAPLPRWAVAVPAALLLALALAAAAVLRTGPCDRTSFEELGLACEIARE